MADTLTVKLIGYWDGPGTSPGWPRVEKFIDPHWDPEVRDDVAHYLETNGRLLAAAAGYSPCRVCGKNNGSVEYTDSVFTWPEGLAHYVKDHEIRLPEEFVQHVLAEQERLESLQRDTQWWREQAR